MSDKRKLIDRVRTAGEFQGATLDTTTWTDIDPLKFYPKWEYGVLSECRVTDKEGAVIDHQKVER